MYIGFISIHLTNKINSQKLEIILGDIYANFCFLDVSKSKTLGTCRTSGVTAPTVESDGTAPSVGVLPQLYVCWQDWTCTHVRESPLCLWNCSSRMEDDAR